MDKPQQKTSKRKTWIQRYAELMVTFAIIVGSLMVFAVFGYYSIHPTYM